MRAANRDETQQRGFTGASFLTTAQPLRHTHSTSAAHPMTHEQEARHTLAGMAAGASIGAIAAGPGGAFVGGVLGGLARTGS